MANETFGLKLPIQVDNDGNFINISDVFENARQNMKMVLLTNPGEKIMNPDFGVGIKNYLFENSFILEQTPLDNLRTRSLETTVKNVIAGQIEKYIKDITVTSIETSVEENKMNIVINYTLSDFLEDTLSLSVGL